MVEQKIRQMVGLIAVFAVAWDNLGGDAWELTKSPLLVKAREEIFSLVYNSLDKEEDKKKALKAFLSD